MRFDYQKITSVELEDVHTDDYPDFTDAYIVAADYKGVEMTERELDFLNEDSDYVYEQVQSFLF